ncbi:ABC transporter permease [Streptomyces sp. NPDC001414]
MSPQRLVRRIGAALLTLWAAATLNFVLFRAIPGDAVSSLRCQRCTPAFRELLRHQLGLDRPLTMQYLYYLRDLLHGDLGQSVSSHRPVTSQLLQPLLATLPMLLLGTVAALLLGVVAGSLAAWRHNTFTDRGLTLTSLVLYSMPAQWLGLMLVMYVALTVGLPVAGLHSPSLGVLDAASWSDSLIDRVQHMVLPSATLGIILFGQFALITRSSLLSALGEDHVLTARAKGLSPLSVVFRHALPNALLPLVTITAQTFGYIVGGAVVIESVFSYPGIGLAVIDAISSRDYPTLQGAFLLLTAAVILANLIADLLYPKLDPRVGAAS